MSSSDGLGIRRGMMAQTRKNKKELKTEFSYNRLWKMLIDRDIKKKELSLQHLIFVFKMKLIVSI